MNPNSRMRSFLRRQPMPAKVMIDGSPKRLVEVPEGRNRWKELIDTLRIEQPETITLLDADGRTLRACEWDVEDAGDEPEAPAEQLKEKDFPIAALAQEFRLMIAQLVEPCMKAMVDSMRASDARAQIYAEGQADAIRAQASADAARIRAEAEQASEKDDTADIMRTVVDGLSRGAQKGEGSNGGV